MKIILVTLILIVLVVAIYTISTAIARAIDTASRDESRRQNQIMRQQQQEFDLWMEMERALAPIRVQAWYNFYAGLATVGVICFAVLLLSLTGCGVWAGVGVSRSLVKYADTQAGLIKLDPVTRQYPLIPYTLAGVPRIYNPNTGSVILLDVRRDETPQMITAAGAVQLGGVIAREAAKSNDPAGVAVINPPLVLEVKTSESTY